jgi:1-acyl-sn-glycerol-3-phosphate acyltransferase
MEWATRTAGWPTVLRPDALAARGRDGLRPSVYGAGDVERMRRRALRDSVAVLVGGGALAVFPEGYPNVDPGFTPKRSADAMLPFHAGFIHVAAAAQRRLRQPIPIVPVGLEYAAGPRWRITLRCGAPLALGDDRDGLRREVQERVTRLSGVRTPGGTSRLP